jgi:nucleotide-binding universal stress UspA family protein
MSGRIERVVLPLDAASDNRTAIDTAVRVAARVEATLHGVFVEDEELLWAAELRFTRQSTLGAGSEPFTFERTALQLQAAAERARQDLATAAEQQKLTWSFEILRGPVERALDSATERDLVVAGGLGRPVAGHFRLECRWFKSVEAAPGPFLLARHAWSDEGGVVTLLRDRNPGSIRLLDLAAQLAEARGGGLIVIRPPDIAETWIAEQLAAYSFPLQIEVAPAEPAVLDRRILELGCRLLAIEAKGAAEGAGSIAARLRESAEKFACDILVLRRSNPKMRQQTIRAMPFK